MKLGPARHLASPAVIKEVLRAHKIRPAHSLGQNFLIDQNILNKIITGSSPVESDTVLEIGPGLGVLTGELLPRVKKIIAVELDPILKDILMNIHMINHKDSSRLEIIHGDILSVNLNELGLKDLDYKVVSNLPYQITSPVLKLLIESRPRPKEIYITIQKEVAERIVANPPDANLMSNFVQFYGEPKVLFNISRHSFWPSPKVDSAFLSIKNIGKGRYELNSEERKSFFRIIKAGFSSKRKQILNNLSHGLGFKKEAITKTLKKISIDPKRRAETLSLDEWHRIFVILGLDPRI